MENDWELRSKKKQMDAKRLLVAEGVSMMHNRHRRRSVGGRISREQTEEILHLQLFVRPLCPQCSENAVAEEVRHLHHVQRVQAHPERHEIEIWAGFPAEGLLRDIVGVLRGFCCEVAASHVH